MARRKPTEDADKVAVEAAVAADRAKTPIERFRAVSRRLLTISPEEVAKQQREYETVRRARRRKAI
jgi:hypothetical protein